MTPEDADRLIQRFGWPDYLVFVAMLAISAVIGIYYAWYTYSNDLAYRLILQAHSFVTDSSGTKQNSTSEFLMAGRSMSTFPVAMSLIAR